MKLWPLSLLCLSLASISNNKTTIPRFATISFAEICNATPGIGYKPDEITPKNKWAIAQNIYDTQRKNLQKSEQPLIPKIIHQIWLGSPLPEKCIAFQKTWKKRHPDWEFKLWTEKEIESFGLQNKTAYDKTRNYGERSDIARYEILYRYGGLYTDTDFECLQSFDDLHHSVSFYTGIAYDEDLVLFNGLIGSAPHHPFLKKCIDEIPSHQVGLEPWKIMERTGPYFFTKCIFNAIPFCNEPFILLPPLFFYSWPYYSEKISPHTFTTELSYAIHYWHASWMP